MPSPAFSLDEAFQRAVAGVASLDEMYDTGLLLMQDKDYARSEVVFRQAIDIDPHDMNATFMLGQALLHQRRYEESEMFFRICDQSSDLNLMAQACIARSLTGQERWEEAEWLLIGVIDTEPTFSEAYLYMSEMYEQRKDLGSALYYAERFISSARFDGETLYEQARQRLELLEQRLCPNRLFGSERWEVAFAT